MVMEDEDNPTETPCKNLIDRIYNACFEHTGEQQLFDDMTAQLVARHPN